MINTRKTLISTTLALLSCQLMAADSFDVIDLGKLDDKPIYVMGLNNSDTAVGYSYQVIFDLQGNEVNKPIHGSAYQNGGLTDLGAIVNDKEDSSAIFGINDNGLAVGYSLEQTGEDSNGNPLSYERAIYTLVGSDTINVVPKFLDENNYPMKALASNNDSLVVGWGYYNPDDDLDTNGELVDTLVERPFIFDTTNNVLTRLDPLNYQQQVIKAGLRDINDNGIAVGWSEAQIDNGRYLRSIIVDTNVSNQLVDIDATEDKLSSSIFAINSSDKVVGKRQIATGKNFTAYIYDIQSQLITDIPPLVEKLIAASSDNSIAYDINSLDQVVGTVIYDVVPNTYHAFLYENGNTVDLNSLIDCKVDPDEVAEGEPDWILSEARSINDNGVIVGNGLLNGTRHAFMLMPRGIPANTCQVIEEDNKGSGSLPLWLLCFLLGGLGINRKLSA